MREWPTTVEVAPSILSADFGRVREQVSEVLAAGAQGHPHRRDGRPFRAGHHVRAEDGGGHRRRHPRLRRLCRRPPDDRAARAAHRPVRRRGGGQHHRARRDVPAPALHAPPDHRARLPGGPHAEPCNARRGDLRGGPVRRRAPVHEREPRLGRTVVHPGDARPAAADARARAAEAWRSRWTAELPGRRLRASTGPARTSSWPARRSSTPRARRTPTPSSSMSWPARAPSRGADRRRPRISGPLPRAGRARPPHGGSEPRRGVGRRARRQRDRGGVAPAARAAPTPRSSRSTRPATRPAPPSIRTSSRAAITGARRRARMRSSPQACGGSSRR